MMRFFLLLRKQKAIHFMLDIFICLTWPILLYFRYIITISEKAAHLQFSLSRLPTQNSEIFLTFVSWFVSQYREVHISAWKVKIFYRWLGYICFVKCQIREKHAQSVHQWPRAALGDFFTHWCLLMQHAQPVQDQAQLKTDGNTGKAQRKHNE